MSDCRAGFRPVTDKAKTCRAAPVFRAARQRFANGRKGV
jgi:hypothetical protein